MTAAPPADPSVLQRLVDAVSTAHVLDAAGELGILDRLAGGPLDAVGLARACAADPEMTGLLLDALTALGVVRREAPDRYALAVEGLPLLASVAWAWSGLAGVVRAGEPMALAHTADGAAAVYPTLVPSLAALFAPAAGRAAQLLAGTGADVLDVGAGAAPWSIALARYSPEVRVTALDLPPVIGTTRSAVEAAGLSDRFDYLPADVFTGTLPEGAYDVVLLANLCHLFDGTQNGALLHLLRPAVRPGGLLAIIDALPPPEPATQPSINLYALGLRLRTDGGAVHPLAAYQAWTRAAGFGPVQVQHLSATPPLSLLACRI